MGMRSVFTLMFMLAVAALIFIAPMSANAAVIGSSYLDAPTLAEEGWNDLGDPGMMWIENNRMEHFKDGSDGGRQIQWEVPELSSYMGDGDVWTISMDFRNDVRTDPLINEIILAIGQNNVVEEPGQEAPDRMVKILFDEDDPGAWRFRCQQQGLNDPEVVDGLAFGEWYHIDIIFNKSGAKISNYQPGSSQDIMDNMADMWLNGELAVWDYALTPPDGRGMVEADPVETIALRVDKNQEGWGTFDNFEIRDGIFVGTAPPDLGYDFQLVADGAVIAREIGATGNPSVIRVPSWIPAGERPDATANYYMYYGEHSGHYIYMKWAETLDGPWTAFDLGGTYNGHTRHGVFDYSSDSLRETYDHVFAPDVHVDDVNQQIIMYYHGKNQPTYTMEERPYTKIWQRHTLDFVATSQYGLNFNDPDYAGGETGHGPVWQAADGPIREVLIAGDYLRTFEYKGGLYGFVRHGQIYGCPDPTDPWKPDRQNPYEDEAWDWGPEVAEQYLFTQAFADHPNNPHGIALVDDASGQRINHVAVNVDEAKEEVELFFYIRKDSAWDLFDDIYRVVFDASESDFRDWTLKIDPATGIEVFDVVASHEDVVAAVQAANPGADPVFFADPSSMGAPGIFIDDDDEMYLFYSYFSAALGGSAPSSAGQISALRLVEFGTNPPPPIPGDPLFHLTGTQHKDANTLYRDGVSTASDNSTVTITTGAVLPNGGLNAYNYAAVTMNDGIVDELRTYDDSTADISGGAISLLATDGNSIATVTGGNIAAVVATSGTVNLNGGDTTLATANGSSIVTVSAGQVDQIDMNNTSDLTVSGGTVTLGSANSSSVVVVSGGQVDQIDMNNTSDLTVSGGTVTLGSSNDTATVGISGTAVVTTFAVNGDSSAAVSGGSVGQIDAHTTSDLTISGGTVSNSSSDGTSTINVVTGADVTNLSAAGSSVLDFSGGNVASLVLAESNTTTMTGGNVTGSIATSGDAVLDITGGQLAQIDGGGNSVITLTGYDWTALSPLSVNWTIGDGTNPGDYGQLLGTGNNLSGYWEDASSWSTYINGNSADIFLNTYSPGPGGPLFHLIGTQHKDVTGVHWDGVNTASDNSTVTITTGGELPNGGLNAYNSAAVTMNDGIVDELRTYDDSTADISGGAISLLATDGNSVATVSGGTVTLGSSSGTATVGISGTAAVTTFSAAGSSVLDISGGNVASLALTASSDATLSGTATPNPAILQADYFTEATLGETSFVNDHQGYAVLDTVNEELDCIGGGQEKECVLYIVDAATTAGTASAVWTLSFDVRADFDDQLPQNWIKIPLIGNGGNLSQIYLEPGSGSNTFDFSMDEPSAGESSSVIAGLDQDTYYHVDLVLNRTGSTLTDYEGTQDLAADRADLWIDGVLGVWGINTTTDGAGHNGLLEMEFESRYGEEAGSLDNWVISSGAHVGGPAPGMAGATVDTLTASGTSTLAVTGGDIVTELNADGDSVTDISGGQIASLNATSNSVVTFYGYDWDTPGGGGQFKILWTIGDGTAVGDYGQLKLNRDGGSLVGKWADDIAFSVPVDTNSGAGIFVETVAGGSAMQAVPEPGTLLMLLIGAAGLLLYRKRR